MLISTCIIFFDSFLLSFILACFISAKTISKETIGTLASFLILQDLTHCFVLKISNISDKEQHPPCYILRNRSKSLYFKAKLIETEPNNSSFHFDEIFSSYIVFLTISKHICLYLYC